MKLKCKRVTFWHNRYYLKSQQLIMESFWLFFIAPVFQIVLSTLRVSKRILMPLGVIGIIALTIAIITSIIPFNTSFNGLKSAHVKCVDCGMVPLAFLVLGLLVTILVTLIIALIFLSIKGIKDNKIGKRSHPTQAPNSTPPAHSSN